MIKKLSFMNGFAALIAFSLFLYISIYGPVAIVPFEKIVRSYANTPVNIASQELDVKLGVLHRDFYYFILVPLLGLLVLGVVSCLNLIFLSKLNGSANGSPIGH